MKCPRCGERTKTYQTRTRPDGRILRRRICRRAKCAKKFKTVEQLVPTGGDYVPHAPRPGPCAPAARSVGARHALDPKLPRVVTHSERSA